MIEPPPHDDQRDTLPADLNAAEFTGAYEFPDNSRRRIPGLIYAGLGLIGVVAWIVNRDSGPVLVNRGLLWAGIGLVVVGGFSISSGWRMRVDEQQALAAAGEALDFPVGHASAQQVWRGVRSRPTWRVLAYSAEEPPHQRGLVLVDAVDGHVVEHLVQDNPDEPVF